ncbi:hypothetical protein [Candidatus Lariskella endosymbiont of Hedychridium roseum]|uniref:hypothetical protein n=1 Tax=Candidatus Lariskella endosymbiont of Hedychridium roseum TaxID=3077949 RepID=UPI0030D31456
MIDLKKFDYKELMKSKLLVIACCILGTLLLALALKYFVTAGVHEEQISPEHSNASKEIDLTRAVDLVSTDDLWRAQIQENIKKQSAAIDEKLNEIKGDLNSIASDNEKLPDIRALEEKIGILGQKIQESAESSSTQALKISDNKAPEGSKKIGQYAVH